MNALWQKAVATKSKSPSCRGDRPGNSEVADYQDQYTVELKDSVWARVHSPDF